MSDVTPIYYDVVLRERKNDDYKKVYEAWVNGELPVKVATFTISSADYQLRAKIYFHFPRENSEYNYSFIDIQKPEEVLATVVDELKTFNGNIIKRFDTRR